jgi:putative FmdB family regulatory protein
MPTYEYECLKCGNVFEEIRSISDPPRRRCPQCRGKVRRLVGNGVGVVFKGSGFYATDSRKERPGPPSSTAGESKAASPAAGDEKPGKTEPAAPKIKPDGSGQD